MSAGARGAAEAGKGGAGASAESPTCDSSRLSILCPPPPAPMTPGSTVPIPPSASPPRSSDTPIPLSPPPLTPGPPAAPPAGMTATTSTPRRASPGTSPASTFCSACTTWVHRTHRGGGGGGEGGAQRRGVGQGGGRGSPAAGVGRWLPCVDLLKRVCRGDACLGGGGGRGVARQPPPRRSGVSGRGECRINTPPAPAGPRWSHPRAGTPCPPPPGDGLKAGPILVTPACCPPPRGSAGGA